MAEGSRRNIVADLKNIKQRQDALEQCANSFAQNGCQAVVITADNARVLDTLVLLSPEMSRQDHEAISKLVSEIIDIMRTASYRGSQFGHVHADETTKTGAPVVVDAHTTDDQPSTSSGEVPVVGQKRKVPGHRLQGNDILNKLATTQLVFQPVEVQTPQCYEQLFLPEGKQQFLIESATESIDDGYRWRKYGRKQVAGSPFLRHYFKCTTPSCHVRKHVERYTLDPKKIVVSYEKLPHCHGPVCPRQYQLLKRLLSTAVPLGNSQTPICATGSSVNTRDMSMVTAVPLQFTEHSTPQLPTATWTTYEPTAPLYDARSSEPAAPPRVRIQAKEDVSPELRAEIDQEQAAADRSLGGSGSAFKQWKVHGPRGERSMVAIKEHEDGSSDSMHDADTPSEDTKDENEDLDLESTGTDVHLFQECVNAIQEHAKWNSSLHA